MDSLFLIQALAVLAFGVCLAHSWRTEGQRAAVQWFFIGYVYALLLISLLVVIGQIAYSPEFLTFGAAPSLVVMLFPAVYYVAYTFAKRFAEPTDLRAMGYLVFLITPWLMLPLDALGTSVGWWSFPTESQSFLGGIPVYIPFAWGMTSAGFYLMVGRIRKIRLRGNGQFFALIIATPLAAALGILLIALIQLIVNSVLNFGGLTLEYVMLAVLYLALPAALWLNIPRLRDTPAPTRTRKK